MTDPCQDGGPPGRFGWDAQGSITGSLPRFFAEDLSGEVVALSASESRHALGVLRLRAGAQVEVFDGTGALAAGTLEIAGRGRATVRVATRQAPQPRPAPIVTLGFAVPKGRRLDVLLEKATELDAAVLAPVVFARSVAAPKWTAHVCNRWRAVCIAAAKQSRSARLPEIVAPQPLGRFLASAGDGVRVLGDPAGASTVPEALRVQPGAAVTILIGPEGGLNPAERDDAVAAGFVPVRLGRNVLRVETAGIAFLAAAAATRGT